MKASKKTHQCDYPGCNLKEAWRCDVKTNWFRGDDVILMLCKEHRQEKHHSNALTSDKAKKQLEQS